MTALHTGDARGPAVTTVMACYNAAATLDAAIGSIRAQSERDWELIVVDDGSTDASPSIVTSLAAGDSRIRLVQQPNAGPSVARNRGVAEAAAPFVAFLDADDTWDPRHLALTLAALRADPRLGVTFAPCLILDAAGMPTGGRTRAHVEPVTLDDILSGNPTSTCSALVLRKQAFVAAGPMRSDMVHAEDQEWLFRVIRAGWTVRGIAEATVGYRTSPGGLSADVERMQRGWQAFIAHARTLAPDLPAAALTRARAHMQLYYAQRRLRAGEAGSAVRTHLWSAARSSPAILAERPLAFAALCIGSVNPSLLDAAAHAARRLRHG